MPVRLSCTRLAAIRSATGISTRRDRLYADNRSILAQGRCHLIATGDIFLSYAHTDQAMARVVVEALRATGAGVWWDQDIPLGANWQQELERQLGQCSVFLLLLGGPGVSGWVGGEVGVALDRHYRRGEKSPLPIVPVLLGKAEPSAIPPFLSQFQYYQLGDGRDPAAIAGLIRALGENLLFGYRKPPVATSPERCPFPGLACYGEDRRAFFLGRYTDIHRALELFSTPEHGAPRRWLRIEGNSGLGKSSLLHAGLLPALKDGWVELGNADCRLQLLGSLRPGQMPLAELARLVARAFRLHSEDLERRFRDPDFSLAHLFAEHLPEEQRRLPLLAIDQFEELFTLGGDHAGERARFDQLLAEAIEDDRYPLYLITTLRSDFLGQFERVPRLNSLRSQAARYELLPVGEAGLNDIVRHGAELAGVTFSDDDLAGEIIREALHEPGALPLVNNLLRLLWEEGHGQGKLQRARYRDLGGLGGALARSADDLLNRLGDQRGNGLRLLLNLVQPGINTPHARRTISRARALDCVGGDAVIIDHLSGHAAARKREDEAARLLMISPAGNRNPEDSEAHADDQIDLIHETLLRRRPDGEPYWPTLWRAIEETDFLEERTRLEQQAAAWRKNPADIALARGRELRRFMAHRPGATEEVTQYLDACAVKNRRHRRNGWIIAAVCLLVLSVLTETVYWLWDHNPGELSLRESLQRVTVHWRHILGIPARPTLVDVPDMPDGSRCFQMGTPGEPFSFEYPAHRVCVPPLQMSAHEITFAQYDAYSADVGKEWPDAEWGRGDQPIIRVSWLDAVDYADWLGEQTGRSCNLPTEAEWEYAGRAGTTTNYSWGDEIGSNNANCWNCGSQWDRQQTTPVATFAPNPWGLFDMHGNVWEWVQDCWHDNYQGAPVDGSAWGQKADDCGVRALRGGSWNGYPDYLRAAYRSRANIDRRDLNLGFRVACRPLTAE